MSQSVIEHCEREVIKRIRSGKLKPSQRLGVGTLARELGVGAQQVRTALDRLAALKVLERRSRSGTYVRQLSLRDYVEVTQARAALEGYAASLACGRIPARTLNQLRRTGSQLDERIRRGDAYDVLIPLEIEFHDAITRASGNLTLINLADSQQLVARYQRQFVLLELPVCLPDGASHTDIVAALNEGSAAKAEQVMRRHVLFNIADAVEAGRL